MKYSSYIIDDEPAHSRPTAPLDRVYIRYRPTQGTANIILSPSLLPYLPPPTILGSLPILWKVVWRWRFPGAGHNIAKTTRHESLGFVLLSARILNISHLRRMPDARSGNPDVEKYNNESLGCEVEMPTNEKAWDSPPSDGDAPSSLTPKL